MVVIQRELEAEGKAIINVSFVPLKKAPKFNLDAIDIKFSG